MTEFPTEIRSRIAETQRSLGEARADGDDFLVDVRLGELESLSRLAADHGVQIESIDLYLDSHNLHSGAPTLAE